MGSIQSRNMSWVLGELMIGRYTLPKCKVVARKANVGKYMVPKSKLGATKVSGGEVYQYMIP